MVCKITECVCHDDCAIIEITKKQPKDKKECSYFDIFNSKSGKRKHRTHIETEE
jgi:hypothetical protein